MLRGVTSRSATRPIANRRWTAPSPSAAPFGRTIKAIEVGGYRVSETLYEPEREIPPHGNAWADLCLAVEGAYEESYGRTRLRCEAASLLFHPPHERHADRISQAGSRCLNIQIAPEVFADTNDALRFESLAVPRRGAPTWLAFQLQAEFEMGDDLSALAVESSVLAILAELARRPGLELRGSAPLWLERVREQAHDEFARTLSLDTLAQTAGVHRVHLARSFRTHFGCTVGEYLRQRRLEFACRELVATATPLSEIAMAAGFADQSHFTNTFRRLIGATPGAFRARFARR